MRDLRIGDDERPDHLDRIATALESIAGESAPPAGCDIAAWLGAIDVGQLEAAVTKRMKSMRQSVFTVALDVLKEWAADGP